VVERICGSCNQVVAAYSIAQGNFLPKIMQFENNYTGGAK
jgi:hypothetical protein